MYKYTDNTQSSFLDFNQPIGLHRNPENRWVKMADAIPWEVKYSVERSGRAFQRMNRSLSGTYISRPDLSYQRKQKILQNAWNTIIRSKAMEWA